MKKELKFRIWNGQEMVYDVMVGKFGAFYVNPSNNGLDEKDSASLSPFNTKYPDGVPVMEWTGLKDKNGKEIYEGDIIQMAEFQLPKELRDDISHHRIYYDEANARFWDERLEDGDSLSGYQNQSIDWVIDGKIIGNVFSNPDLLKTQNV